jgi:hypothetical protein
MVNCLLTVALVWLVKVTVLRVFGDKRESQPNEQESFNSGEPNPQGRDRRTFDCSQEQLHEQFLRS